MVSESITLNNERLPNYGAALKGEIITDNYL